MHNLANSTFDLYVLCIKLAHKTTQFRRLLVENFITVVYSLFGRIKHVSGLSPQFWGFGATEYRSPLCQQATFTQCVNYGSTNVGKSICWHTGE